MKKNTSPKPQPDVAKPFAQSSGYFAPQDSDMSFHERTKRNQLWLGGTMGQQRLRKMSVAVAGLGGMGSNIAEALVRAGIGGLRIADPDTIDVSNINRQVIANRQSIGKSKAETSARELRNIATDFELVVYDQGVNPGMADEFVRGCHAVVDEIDVFPLDRHVDLHRAARRHGLPLYSAYVVGMGIHFYKFHGDKYTFEDFLGVGEAEWKKPTADFLLDRFGHPLPDYLDDRAFGAYRQAISEGGVPIFGPTTLLGHSMVTTRLVVDLLRDGMLIQGFPETPVMPEFLVLDPVNFTFKKVRVPGT